MSTSPEDAARDEIPPEATSDEVIKRLVVDELYWDSRVDASKVLVEVTDGVVVLTGHVPTYTDFYSAEADARMIRGVVTVENRIQVDRPKIVPDREIRESITNVFNWTPDLESSDLDVSVLEGVVTLRGTVPQYSQKRRAQLAVGRVRGVIRVIDESVVTPSERIADHEIAHALTGALERRLFDDIARIQMTVEDGVVTLRGLVSNAAAYEAVQQAAEHTTGVVAVRNELTFPQESR